MPGIMPSIIKQLAEEIEFPIIAGGLIQTREDAEIAIRAGASAISTSHYEVWIQEEKKECNFVIELKNVSKVYKMQKRQRLRVYRFTLRRASFCFSWAFRMWEKHIITNDRWPRRNFFGGFNY